MKILSEEIETTFMMNMELKRNDIFFTRSKFDDIYKKMNLLTLIFSRIFNLHSPMIL